MGLSLAGLGSAAGGLAQGMERGQRMTLADMDINLQKKRDSAEDAQFADTEAARAAAARVMQEDQAAYQAQIQQAANQPGPTEDGGPVQPAAMAPYQPSEQIRLKAAQAHADELFKRGRTEEGVKAWAVAEGRRAQVRGAAAQQVQAAMTAGGDISSALKSFYETIDDGYDLGPVQTTQGLDGKPALVITRINKKTGEAQPPATVSPDALLQRITMLAANPQDVARQALAEKLALFKGDQDIRVNQAKHSNTLEEIDRRGSWNMEVADQKGDVAKEVAKTRVSGAISVAELRKAAGGSGGGDADGVARTVTNNDGTRTIIMRRPGPDGRPVSHTLVDNSGKPLIGMEAEKALQSLSGLIGKSIEGSLASPEVNRKRAAGMLPQPPAAVTPQGQGKRELMPKSRDQLKTGTIYETARGPARWNGTAFEAVE